MDEVNREEIMSEKEQITYRAEILSYSTLHEEHIFFILKRDY